MKYSAMNPRRFPEPERRLEGGKRSELTVSQHMDMPHSTSHRLYTLPVDIYAANQSGTSGEYFLRIIIL